jgi:hypothetical protein
MADRIPNEVLNALYAPVGQIIISWALAEQLLENCVLVFSRFAGGKNIEPELPWQLGPKLKFSRKCLNKLESLSAFKEEGIKLVDEMAALSDVRHTFIHGAVSKYDKQTNTLLFVRLDVKNNTRQTIHRKITADFLITNGAKCVDLATRLSKFLERLIKAFVPKEIINKHPGPIRG